VRGWKGVARTAFDLLFPPDCLLCLSHVPAGTGDLGLCADCLTAFTGDTDITCPRCATTVGPHTDLSDGCTRCLNESYRFASVVRLGKYDGLLRDAILRSKHLSGEQLATTAGTVLGRRLLNQPDYTTADVVIPIPLHWRKRIVRGYNQAAEVAHAVAGVLNRPCRPRFLRRVKPTPPQPAQSAQGRRLNVVGAFAVPRRVSVRGLRIVLVDDVMTTGATVNEASGVLLTAGAAQVRVAVVAHR
jgi:ComF family protein